LLAHAQERIDFILQHPVTSKQRPQALVFLDYLAGSTLHVLRCSDAFLLVLLHARLQVLDQILAPCSRAALIVSDPDCVIDLGELVVLQHNRSSWIRRLFGVTNIFRHLGRCSLAMEWNSTKGTLQHEVERNQQRNINPSSGR
jgi:hypothetical protein